MGSLARRSYWPGCVPSPATADGAGFRPVGVPGCRGCQLRRGCYTGWTCDDAGCERPREGVGKVCQGMIKIRARGNESVEQMLRRFKKMCEKEGLNKQIKKNSYYEKPSERRRRRIRKAVARRERTARA